MRNWLVEAGYHILVSRHRKGYRGKDIDNDLLRTMQQNKRFTVALAAQRFGVIPRTIKNKLRRAGKKEFINRVDTPADYSEFELGMPYRFYEDIYIATPQGLFTRKNGKLVEGIACLNVYQIQEEMQTREIWQAWGVHGEEFDRLIEPLMHYPMPAANPAA